MIQNHLENPSILQCNLIKLQYNNNNLEQVFTLIDDNFDKYMFDSIVKMFQKAKCFDLVDEYFKELLSSQPTITNEQNIKQVLQQLIKIFQNLQNQDFFHFNFLNYEYQLAREELIPLIKNNEKSLEFLKFLVRLTAIDSRFIQCGSNSLNLLVVCRADFQHQSFEEIRIKDTSLVGANFACSNLSCSQIDNVNINGMNLNGAILFNCKWYNVRINELNKLDSHIKSVCTVCFSPNSSTLASGSDNSSICLWAIKTGRLMRKLDGHKRSVISVCFSADGSTLVSGSDDKSIRLWNIKKGRLIRKMKGHRRSVTSVCFSPDGSTLASGSWDWSIRIWDVKKGKQKAKLDGHSDCIYSVCFSPDSSTLASGSDDQSIRLWDVKTGQEKAKLDGHSNRVLSVCFSPDGSTLASGSGDYSIRLWISKRGCKTLNWPSKVILSSPSASLLTDPHWRQAVVIALSVFGMSRQDRKSNRILCFSQDGSTLASGSADKSIRLWNVKTVQQKVKQDDHCNQVISFYFSPDGFTLASCGWDKSINVKEEQQKVKLDGHSDAVCSVCFSPDSSTLASGSNDWSIRLWDVKTGQEKAKLDGHCGWVFTVCSRQQKKQKVQLNGRSDTVRCVCFSPDGSTLASGSEDSSIILWDVKTGEQKAKLESHSGWVLSNCFSPDSPKLAQGSYDKFTRLWDVKTGKEIPITDNRYQFLSEQFIQHQFYSCQEQYSAQNITVLRVAQSLDFQAQQALILKGEFINYSGINLINLLKSKGSVMVESLFNIQ